MVQQNERLGYLPIPCVPCSTTWACGNPFEQNLSVQQRTFAIGGQQGSRCAYLYEVLYDVKLDLADLHAIGVPCVIVGPGEDLKKLGSLGKYMHVCQV